MPISLPSMPQPTEDQLSALRHSIGAALPASYTEFVMLHDGAEPEANSIITADNEVGVTRFIPVSEAAGLGSGIEGFPQDVIPLAEDDCGNYFYVEPSSGAVYLWDREIEGADECVGESVLAFVARLAPFDHSKVTLEPGQVLGVWVNPSFKPEF